MGLITQEEIQKNRISYVTIDKDEGFFICNEEKYPGISGQLIGFGEHTFEFKNRTQYKFDIYIYDDTYYQVQIGKYSWLNFKLLNQLLAIPPAELTAPTNKIKLFLAKKDEYLNIFVEWNGKYLGWKFQFAQLKFEKKVGIERETHRNSIVDKWVETLISIKQFDRDEIFSEKEKAFEEPIEMIDNGDDFPF